MNRVTIIPIDNKVNVDGIAYSGLDLSACQIPSDINALQWLNNAGWIEFTTDNPNEEITTLPAWASACVLKWEEANTPKPPLPPEPPTAEENKTTAIILLQQTDWTITPDVGDPTKSNPYLSNVAEFIEYRNSIRQYAIYPVSGFIDFPQLPEEIWTNT